MSTFAFLEEDLAPGDRRGLPWDASPFTAHRIRSHQDPCFERAYDRLWQEFGAAHEMETREVIIERLNWQTMDSADGIGLRYEMAAVAHQDRLVAVRDHVAIALIGESTPSLVVHLSHVVVEPAWRRTGLAAWLRALPVQTARDCAKRLGIAETIPMTLVAEMEHPIPHDESRMIRLKAYEKAGFRKLDPQVLDYRQPDFRPPETIDQSGGACPLPFGLIVRRIGLESEQTMPVDEARALVAALYRMYARSFRSKDMAGLWGRLNGWRPGGSSLALVN